MATDLGKAYVQIMPSAKGISGSIQKAVMPEAKKAGNNAGSAIATNISKSMGKMGGQLTKAITVPVAGAITAVSGLIGVLGFKRLVGLDSAQAKLKGLGYDAEAVERISKQVETAIEGGMTTMAEGVDVAAGALAAGVDEGKELEQYIKMVGDAAIGANRPVSDMAMIFNRVQGSGKLMTQELNMVEEGMPGFAKAMADEVAGGSLEAFREMVTNGEVGSKDFLNVMDDFAGGMAGAYSGSWAGMAKNVLAYVGIIGESLLEGLFKDGKEGLSNFIDVLKSDEVMDWAQSAGEKIREFAHMVVDGIKSVIDWWVNLSDGTKDVIKAFGLFAVVAGPILMVISKIVGMITPLITIFKALGVVIGAIASPIGLVVAAIVAAAALIFIYWEPIKEFFVNLWNSVKLATMVAWNFIKQFFITFWEFMKEMFLTVFEWLKTTISAAWNWIKETTLILWNGIKQFFIVFWEGVKTIFLTVFEFLKNLIQTVWNTIKNITLSVWNAIKNTIINVVNGIKNRIKTVWNAIKGVTSSAWNGIKSLISRLIKGIKNNISSIFNVIKSVVTGIWNGIKRVTSSVWGGIKGAVSSVVGGIKSTISGAFNTIKSTVSNIWNGIKSTTKSVWDSMVGIVKAPINMIITAINGMINGINKISIKSPKIPSWVPKFGGKQFKIGFNIPNIPSLDVGTNFVAGDGLAMLHKGEAVVPKKYNPSAGGIGTQDNRTVNIKVDAGNLNEVQRVIELFTGLKQANRAY